MRLRAGLLRPYILLLALAAGTSSLHAIEIAGELFVDLDAADASAGTALWANDGTLGDFTEAGDPVPVTIGATPAVRFDGADDAYVGAADAPAGLVGVDATCTIEAWVLNDAIADEETILSWGKRGGPDGTNMSFNYGAHAAFGAVGHWGASDIGWGTVPTAGLWHHLAYTYDGTTTRVYADGVLTNSEVLAAGVINTHPDTAIALASQWEGDGATLTGGLKGSLAISRVRIHDGVLSDAQILMNYNEEAGSFLSPPSILDAPSEDSASSLVGVYTRSLTIVGDPPLTLTADPAGATVTAEGSGSFTYSFAFGDPAPASFDASVTASNAAGSDTATWTVTVIQLQPGVVATAGELLVDLDAAAPSAGTATWINNGTASGDFTEAGDAVAEVISGVPAVTFDGVNDYYVQEELAPAGIVGLDPTRSVEAWVYNTQVPSEETILSWGRRGGPDGTNVSFNYGTHGTFGAVGKWGAPDIGWNNAGGAPEAGTWHHLAYTYDGTTTRVYADGSEANSEFLGAGRVNTHADTAILLAAQWANATTVEPGLRGSLSLARVRIHDGVLRAAEIAHNYQVELDILLPPAPQIAGDCDQNGERDISDVLCYVTTQFSGFVLIGNVSIAPCQDPLVLDVNGDGAIDVSDTIYLAMYLFLGGSPPVQGVECFAGPREGCDDNIGC